MQQILITPELRRQLSLKSIHFSYNWNNKLACKSFSTIRIANPDKYQLLDLFEVTVKKDAKHPKICTGVARLQSITDFYLHKVSPGMSYLDANLSTIDFQLLVLKMYKNKKVDFKQQPMCFLVFQYLSENDIIGLSQNLK